MLVRLINVVDVFAIQKFLSEVGKMQKCVFRLVDAIGEGDLGLTKTVVIPRNELSGVVLNFNYDQKYGIEFTPECESSAPWVRALKNDLQLFFVKIKNMKWTLLRYLDRFPRRPKDSKYFLFLFDSKKRLLYLSGMPNELSSLIFRENCVDSIQSVYIDILFKSKVIRKYISDNLEELLEEKIDFRQIENPHNFEFEIIKDGPRDIYKGFSIGIDIKTLLCLEKHPDSTFPPNEPSSSKKKFPSKLKQTHFKNTGFMSVENHLSSNEGASEDSLYNKEEEFQIEPEEVEFGIKRKNTDVRFDFDYKRMEKPWSLRQSILHPNQENIKNKFEREGLLKRSSQNIELMRDVGSSYAMEYFPDDFKNPAMTRKSFQSDVFAEFNLKQRSPTKLDHFQGFVKNNEDVQIFTQVTKIETELNEDVFKDWNYNILGTTSNEELALVMKLFTPYLTVYSIKKEKFFKFVNALKQNYNKNGNSFHNFHHGVSVVFSSNYFLSNLPDLQSNLSLHMKFGFLVACLAHDVGHTGKNNNYEINSKSKLAMRYNDRSPLEQHHIAKLFSLIYKHKINIFETLTAEILNEMRHIIIECILATDMKVHFSLLEKFNNVTKNSEKIPQKDLNELSLCMLIHGADISGSAKTLERAGEWSKLVAREFTNQYNLEVEKNLPVTAYFKDLHIPQNFYKSELSFLNFIVKPLYQSFKAYKFGNRSSFENDEPASIKCDLKSEESFVVDEIEKDEVFAKSSASNPFVNILTIIEENIEHYEKAMAATNDPVAKVQAN
jgi:hypothetical protein